MSLVDEQRDGFAALGDDIDELVLALLGLSRDLEGVCSRNGKNVR